MSLADALKPADRPPSHLCNTCWAWKQMDEGDRATLDEWLADERVELSTITRTLRSEGHYVNAQSVARHAHGDCRLRRVFREKVPK